MIETIKFRLNRKAVQLKIEGERMLLWVLRSDLGLTGTKYGCGEGLCGACTVLVNGKAMRSCQTPVKEVAGKRVLTIEGLARNERLHPLQKAFAEHHAFQCGYCTSGMIMSAYSFLNEVRSPSEEEILRGMNDNFCRCGSHVRIVKAILAASKEMKGGRR